MHRCQQGQGDAETQDPAACREQRHVHVIEHEHLIAQHRQQVQVLRPFVMRDGGDGRLEARDVRFQGDGHLVAEPALHARADRAQEPRPRCGQAEADGRPGHEIGALFDDAAPEQHEPEGEQRVGQRRQL
jgi:hypothetical protein